jgi:hypothetical protein
MMTPSEGLSTEASTMASGRNGMTRNQSVKTHQDRLGHPARYPATIPMKTRSHRDRGREQSDDSETREPQIVRVRTERP